MEQHLVYSRQDCFIPPFLSLCLSRSLSVTHSLTQPCTDDVIAWACLNSRLISLSRAHFRLVRASMAAASSVADLARAKQWLRGWIITVLKWCVPMRRATRPHVVWTVWSPQRLLLESFYLVEAHTNKCFRAKLLCFPHCSSYCLLLTFSKKNNLYFTLTCVRQ